MTARASGTFEAGGRRRCGWPKSASGLASLTVAAALALSAGGAQAAEKLIIGSSFCLTGIQAAFDDPSLKGAQVAVKALNDAGGVLGREVELINLDGKSDPVVVGNATVQVIEAGAEIVIAPCDFDFGSPASREAQNAGLVGISTCASSPLYNSFTLGDKQFTLSMWNHTMGAAAAEFALSKGWKNAWVVTDTFIDYTTSLSEFFITHLQNNGGTVLLEDKYTQGDQDFSAQLARLKGSEIKPDVLFISSYMPDMGTIIRTIREAGIDTPVLGGDSYDDGSLWAALGEKFGNEVYFVTHSFLSPEVKPEMGKFLELYRAYHGKDPDSAIAATGWDTVMVLAQAVEAAGTTEGAALARKMEELEFDLLTGKLDWSDAATGHEPDIEAILIQLEDGKPAFIGWTRPTNPPKPF